MANPEKIWGEAKNAVSEKPPNNPHSCNLYQKGTTYSGGAYPFKRPKQVAPPSITPEPIIQSPPLSENKRIKLEAAQKIGFAFLRNTTFKKLVGIPQHNHSF